MATTKKELRTVKYIFTPEEIKSHSADLAQACKTREETEAEKKAVMSSFKAKIESQNSRIGLLSQYITNGYDWRSVECNVKKNLRTGRMEYIYQGEIVDTRPISEMDLQLSLEDDLVEKGGNDE